MHDQDEATDTNGVAVDEYRHVVRHETDCEARPNRLLIYRCFQSSSHPVIQSSSHPVIQSSSHPQSWSFVGTDRLTDCVARRTHRHIDTQLRCKPSAIHSDKVPRSFISTAPGPRDVMAAGLPTPHSIAHRPFLLSKDDTELEHAAYSVLQQASEAFFRLSIREGGLLL